MILSTSQILSSFENFERIINQSFHLNFLHAIFEKFLQHSIIKFIWPIYETAKFLMVVNEQFFNNSRENGKPINFLDFATGVIHDLPKDEKIRKKLKSKWSIEKCDMSIQFNLDFSNLIGLWWGKICNSIKRVIRKCFNIWVIFHGKVSLEKIERNHMLTQNSVFPFCQKKV